MAHDHQSGPGFGTGLIIGSLLGAIAGIMFAPKPGDETRAQVLEKTMNEGLVKSEVRALEFLANAWIQSRELGRAVPPLGKAAQKSEDGELFLRLAHLHIEREAWADAVGALESCLKRGAVKHPGQVHLLKGIAHFSLKQTTHARGAFQKAGQFEATRASSRQWLKHLDER